MEQNVHEGIFPAGLLDWAGHRTGGVRRLFYSASGRPSGEVIRTRLLNRLEDWTESIAQDITNVPKVVLLVGGPGNGKTEAIEFTICGLDEALGLSGRLINILESQFLANNDQPAPRLAKVALFELSNGRFSFDISIVQDASASDASNPGLSPASLLVENIEQLLEERRDNIYLACVNRGILDDALIAATEGKRSGAQALLETIVRSVGMGPDAPSCWPLSGYPSIAVWPMDVESLIMETENQQSPANQLLTIATNPTLWPATGTCPAGDRCPFCTSRALLSGEPYKSSLLKILRWYELASGKRWSFRDLFSLLSYMLAGVPADDANTQHYNPCDWAARLQDLASKSNGKPDSLRLSAPFLLVASQYQHAIFGGWPSAGIRNFRRDLKELKLQDNPTLLGLYYFLASSRGHSVPPTLESQLIGLSEHLDPAIADPDMKVEVSARTVITFRDIDTRFSQSVGEGLSFIQKYKCLTPLEIDLLKMLASADQELSEGDVVRHKPAVAARVRALVRDFSCRLVRRSIGVRAAVIHDALLLADFQKVIDGEITLLHEAVNQVRSLLNEKERFVTTLNTTFGEPLPPVQRRVVLTTDNQKVKIMEPANGERPIGAIRFLSVGGGDKPQSIPLTYELFKSVRELRMGMIPASLPRAVVALLDTTRARLAGKIVRDEEMLEGGEIKIGLRKDVIVREFGAFLVKQADIE